MENQDSNKNTNTLALLVYWTQEESKVFAIDDPSEEELKVLRDTQGIIVGCDDYPDENQPSFDRLWAALADKKEYAESLDVPENWKCRWSDCEVEIIINESALFHARTVMVFQCGIFM